MLGEAPGLEQVPRGLRPSPFVREGDPTSVLESPRDLHDVVPGGNRGSQVFRRRAVRLARGQDLRHPGVGRPHEPAAFAQADEQGPHQADVEGGHRRDDRGRAVVSVDVAFVDGNRVSGSSQRGDVAFEDALEGLARSVGRV